MRLLSWNVRGLGAAAKKRAVRNLIRQHNGECVILLESKLELVSEFLVKKIWVSDKCEFAYSPSIGRSGGIVICWDEDRFKVSRTLVEERFVCIEGCWLSDNWMCGFMGIYAPCDIEQQRILWERLLTVMGNSEVPWCLIGDFNMVTCLEERRGCAMTNRGIDEFVEFVQNSGLVDLELRKHSFTWFGADNRCRRLDRCLVSPRWIDRYANLCLSALPRGVSDHTPLLLVSDVLD
ncbi:hypothetical protein HRI_001683200 [Hibiscus trionum]|uniref:Endonuclease/exonuclease/phosphatase domain-containing protein n=1 Tax=Hibiscus trionum TaxID=183268 RepID=A0A9W7HMI1_HIBTR|nr:hypothetical protein HRI_001683200 [Hibiscus trionum]